jgi:Ca-activated chloride channel family protein
VKLSELFFADSWILWILGPTLVLWLVAWWLLPWVARKRRQAAAVRFSSLETLKRLKSSRTLLVRRAVLGLRVLVLILIALAMARPQTGRTQTQVRTEGVDIALVVDTSGSMRALDLDGDRSIARRRNRLDVVSAHSSSDWKSAWLAMQLQSGQR